MIKLNTLLAKVDHSQSMFNRMVGDYAAFFKKNQGMFQGIKKTFKPRDGYAEDARYMGTTKVATTVEEKLEWFEQNSIPYLNELFAVEATNSAGAPRVELIVDGISFGKLTALDLMRLKTILTSKPLEDMYNNIPVRSDAEVWLEGTDPEYAGRSICQTEMLKGVTRTTESEECILKDPNLDPARLPANYNAKVTIKRKTVETGDYTLQKFTGEWTQRQRAELLRRRSNILAAVTEALKVVNDTPAENPNLDVDKLITFLHHGK